MLEHPKNFEEAKIIIKNSVNDDYYGNKRRIALLRLLFSLGVGLGLGTFFAISNGHISYIFTMMPATFLASAPFMKLYADIKKHDKTIIDESYFKMPEKYIMEIANDYVDEYNMHEIKKGRIK